MDAGSPVVMVVEDEPLIRMLAAEVLADAGCQVMEAGNAAAALDTLTVAANSIDVLFTDVQMPGSMNGVGLARHVHAHWPWIKLLIVSSNPRENVGALPPGSRFVAKPYELDRIVSETRELARK